MKQNAMREDKLKRLREKAEQEEYSHESDRGKGVKVLEAMWEENGIAECHRILVKNIIDQLSSDDLFHKVCMSELSYLEDCSHIVQKIQKFYDMRLRCIDKIEALNKDLLRLGDNSDEEEMSLKLIQDVI